MNDPVTVNLGGTQPVAVHLGDGQRIADLGQDAPRPAWWIALQAIEGLDPEAVRGIVNDELAERLSSGGSIHHGEGEPPSFIPGARVGDVYIDTTTGDLYTLGG